MIKHKSLRWAHIGLMRLASLIRYVHRLKYWEFFSIIVYHLEQRQNSILFLSPYYLPLFYKECLDAWATLNEVSVLSYEDLVNQILWNNKNITLGKVSIFDKNNYEKRNCCDW